MSSARPRPLVGVTTYRQTTSWWAWERDAALVPGSYLDVIEAAGGQPLLIPPPAGDADRTGPTDRTVPTDPTGPADRGSREVDLGALVAALDALVLIGGGDLDARAYGQTDDPRNGGTNRRRDVLEFGLLAAALDQDLPVLAVCRGLQVLNVHLGGELVQQLVDVVGTNDHQPRPGAFGSVTVTTEPGSMVRRVLGDRIDVRCCHHQGLATLGRDLVATARSGDGVVEAVELPGRRFVVGVQWHPEEVGDVRLFDALLAAADDRSRSDQRSHRSGRPSRWDRHSTSPEHEEQR